jgi:hypothetical protein
MATPAKPADKPAEEPKPKAKAKASAAELREQLDRGELSWRDYLAAAAEASD